MELDRKAFHFDLDNEFVERFYTGKKNPWSDIQDFLESHCFEKPQYSGYESAENIVMSYQRAYGTIDEMMYKFPWFQKCVLGLEELDFFGSEIGDMKSATAGLSKRNGLEPPKDLNNEH